MALDHGDLFFINRSGATYKIEAVELGNYLTNNPLPGGDYIVNDGILSIANTGNPNLSTPVVLHSANTPFNSILDFDKHFVVQSVGADATVSINFMEFKDTFLCNSGVGSGFDINNCDCLQLDFDEIGNRLPCVSGGIVSDNGCLLVNLCEDSLINLSGTNNGAKCLDVSICGDQGIDISKGCIGVDMGYISSNITCGDPDSGLTNGGNCIAVDFGKVLSKIALGAIVSTDKSVKFDKNSNPTLVGNQDLRKGNVDLSVDWSQNPAAHKCEGDKLEITVNNGPAQGTYNPCANQGTQTINLNITGGNGSGSGDPVKLIKAGNCIKLNPTNGNLNNNDVTIATDLSVGTGCDQVRDCLNIDDNDVDEDLCAKFGKLYASSAVFYKDENAQRPTIVMGAGKGGSSTGRFVGITGATTGESLTCSVGPMADEPGECGIVPQKGNTDDTVIFFIRSKVGEVKIGPIQDAADSQSVNVCHNVNGRLSKKKSKSSDSSIVYTASNSTEVASFNVDSIIDSLTGCDHTTPTSLDTGLFKFACYKDSVNKTLDGPIPYYPNVPSPVVFVEQLSQVHPSLVHWTWTDDSYEDGLDEYGEITKLLKENESDRVPVASDVNRDSLLLLSLGAIGLQKRRNADLQDKVTALETTVAAMEARLVALETP